MSITVYNTLSREKEPFEPVVPGKVGMYVCGPTVYKPSHIGHAVGPIIFDAIKRYLVHRGYDVNWVVNITDVDDKLIAEAAKQNTTVVELAERVTKDYLGALAELNIETIDTMPKASEHMGDIVGMIEQLIERGHAYPSGGDVYFDVTSCPDYGKLSNRRLEEQTGQRELQSGEKRNPGDFALWKAAKPEEPAEVKYDSPWGPGRPGWHIECSAMSSRYLGETFDIHGGGMDLVFPHHENEIAQSECASGKQFVKYWMHNGLTRFNTKKVAKSDTSPEMQQALVKMTLHNLLDTYPGELVRFFVLATHYRRPIEYSEAEIESKRKGLDGFYRLFERVESLTGTNPYDVASLDAEIADASLLTICKDHDERFHAAMDDDFNTAGAIAALFEFATALNKHMAEKKLESGAAERELRDFLHATGRLIALAQLIGVFLRPVAKSGAAGADDESFGQLMQLVLDVRQAVRQKKDFETADLIRDRLTEMGVTVEDRPDGATWRRG
jgi:cysteinyl-tRNA synthetase